LFNISYQFGGFKSKVVASPSTASLVVAAIVSSVAVSNTLQRSSGQVLVGDRGSPLLLRLCARAASTRADKAAYDKD